MIENWTSSSTQENTTENVCEQTLSAQERQTILFDWNQTENEYPRNKTIRELFEEQAAANPDSVALLYADQTITYAELNARANQLAHYLINQGIRPDSLIAVCMESSFDLFIAILAILKAGCAYLPLDPNYPVERRQYMLDDTRAACLITHSFFVKQFGRLNTQVISLDKEADQLSGLPKENPEKNSHAESLLYVIYTSGSTGKPKGVMLTHHNLHNFINWISQALEVNKSDIFDFSSSISFDFSVFTTIVPLVNGARIAICPEHEKKDPELYNRHLHKNKVTIIKLTPSYFRQLKEFVKPEYDFKDLRWIVFGGELLLGQDIKDWVKRYPHHKILNEYGPTEAAVATSWIKINKNNIDQFTHGIPIGKPAYNSQLYILDPEMNPVPPGVEGELYIGGEGVAKGYLNQAEMTAARFVTNPFRQGEASRLYRTGDLCRFLPDGNIEFIGRVDHQIKIRGFRIETSEIEMRLAAYDNIKEAVVMARDDMSDQTGEKRLVAYCLLKDKNSRPDLRYLREFLHKSLPDYMIPAAFVLMESFPLSPNGKLDRKALPEPEQTNYHHYHAPRTALEQIIADIWSEVLNLKLISVDDNFFELGGHSLSGARIISKIMKATHKEIKLADLYDAPTISLLANVVGHAKEADKKIARKREKLAGGKKIPLGDMQLLLWLAQKSYSKSQSLNIVARKRVMGMLDLAALQYAFECVLKTHDILCFYVSPYVPLQYPQQHVEFDLHENDISALSFHDQDDVLMNSLSWLKTYHQWKKGRPLIEARLFRLGSDQSEIQLAISHMAGDEFSPEIIFSDLSLHYLNYKNNKKGAPARESVSYTDYALEERENLDITLKRDIPFWDDYLKDASLFSFPKEEVIDDSKPDQSYTTYIEITDQAASRLQLFCILNRLSILDSLCAVTGSVLEPYLVNKQGSMVINIVKSTRHDDKYDDTVGCFVTANLIKMDIRNAGNIVEIAKQAQKSTSETAPHQFCPPIVKLASKFQCNWKRKKIRNSMIRACSSLASYAFPSLQLHGDVLNFYGKMMLAETDNHFLVEVNVLNNFISMNNHQYKQQFGYDQERLGGVLKDDRMVGKNVLDIRFERDTYNKAHLVICSNLSRHLREKIGSDILSMLANIK